MEKLKTRQMLQIKYKVMKERLKKLKETVNSYNLNERTKKLLIDTLNIINEKYEENFNKILDNENINKSIKYKQLEIIVFEEIAKIENWLQKEKVKRM